MPNNEVETLRVQARIRFELDLFNASLEQFKDKRNTIINIMHPDRHEDRPDNVKEEAKRQTCIINELYSKIKEYFKRKIEQEKLEVCKELWAEGERVATFGNDIDKAWSLFNESIDMGYLDGKMTSINYAAILCKVKPLDGLVHLIQIIEKTSLDRTEIRDKWLRLYCNVSKLHIPVIIGENIRSKNLDVELKELKENYKKKNDEVNMLQNLLDSLDSQALLKQKEALDSKSTALRKQKKELDSKSILMSNIQYEIELKEEQLREKNSKLSTAEHRLYKKVTMLSKRIQELQEKKSDLNNIRINLRTQKKSLNNQIRSFEADRKMYLRAKQRYIYTLSLISVIVFLFLSSSGYYIYCKSQFLLEEEIKNQQWHMSLREYDKTLRDREQYLLKKDHDIEKEKMYNLTKSDREIIDQARMLIKENEEIRHKNVDLISSVESLEAENNTIQAELSRLRSVVNKVKLPDEIKNIVHDLRKRLQDSDREIRSLNDSRSQLLLELSQFRNRASNSNIAQQDCDSSHLPADKVTPGFWSLLWRLVVTTLHLVGRVIYLLYNYWYIFLVILFCLLFAFFS